MKLIAANPDLLEGTAAEQPMPAESDPEPETDDAGTEENDAPANETDNAPEGGADE